MSLSFSRRVCASKGLEKLIDGRRHHHHCGPDGHGFFRAWNVHVNTLLLGNLMIYLVSKFLHACILDPPRISLPHVPSLFIEPLLLLSSISSSPEHSQDCPFRLLDCPGAGRRRRGRSQGPASSCAQPRHWLVAARSRKRPSSQPADGVGHGASPRSVVPRRITGSACSRLIATSLRDHKPEVNWTTALPFSHLPGWSRAPAGPFMGAGARTLGPFEDAENGGKLEAKGPREA